MAHCDFVVKYDPKKDSAEDVTKRILYSLYVSRLKNKKPVVTFVGGDSGEGKSWSVLKFMEILAEIQGYDLKDCVNDVNVYIPIEYPEKLDSLLFDKELKKVNMIAIHEARSVIKAKNWHSFVNQAISDVNALSRSVKRLHFFIISQFIKDIDSSIRYTLTYYITVKRPKNKRPRLSISKMWKDDRDLEKPKLRKRKISGYLVYPDGKYRKYSPKYLELSKPSQEIIDIFEKNDTEAKAEIIRSKMVKLQNEMKAEVGEESKKIDKMVEYYTENTDRLLGLGKRYKNGFRISKEIQNIHDLSKFETEMFQKKINNKLQEMGIMKDE